MALNLLKVYSKYAYTTYTEVLRQQIQLFNTASNGTLVLSQAANQGDFSESAFYKRIPNLIRNRNAYGTNAVDEKFLEHNVDRTVKVGRGVGPIRMDKGDMQWIQRSPEEQGVVLGRQLAIDGLADLVNTAIGAVHAALVQETEVVKDITGDTVKTMSFNALNSAKAKFGDASNQVNAWIMHSTPMHSLFDKSLTNTERLFEFGTVAVNRDPFGVPLIMTDSPNLITSGSPDVFHTLGLTAGAVHVEQNNDWFANENTNNGYENIITTYQAQWSFNLSLKGFAWDKDNGGKSPTDASIFASSSWDRNVESHKDLAGVLLLSQ